MTKLQGIGVYAWVALASACDARITIGSDLIWTARFESGTLDEWTMTAGGGTVLTPPSNELAVTTDPVHQGSFAARTTMTTSADPVSALSALVREDHLPDEAFYSSWFLVPQNAATPSAPVVQYWAIMRFRARTAAGDPSSTFDLYDVDLRSSADGGMALRVFDYVPFTDAPMVENDPAVPVGRWFHVEAFYRNASDSNGRLTVWLDGRLAADIAKPTGAPGWVGWQVGNMGMSLNPKTVTLYVDDCAVSRVRVRPTGVLAL